MGTVMGGEDGLRKGWYGRAQVLGGGAWGEEEGGDQ